MDAPDRFTEHVGNGEHLQLRERSLLGNRNAVGHDSLFEQALADSLSLAGGKTVGYRQAPGPLFTSNRAPDRWCHQYRSCRQ